MNKITSLLSLLLINGSIACGETTEPASQPQYSLEKIVTSAKSAWQNKWVKVGVVTAAAASLYGLGVKYNVITLPAFLCTAKTLTTNTIETDSQPSTTSNTTTTENSQSSTDKLTTGTDSEENKEEQNSPSKTNPTEQNSSVATANNETQSVKKEASQKKSSKKPYIVRTPAQQMLDDAKTAVAPIFEMWKNRKDYTENGEY